MLTSPPLHDAPVGIFDSGLGGLSILRHVRAQLPHEHLLYVADTGFAPYGDKPEHVVAERSLAVARFLVERGAKAIVVACNTATVSAVKLMRETFPHMPIVGVEPGLKPAAALTKSGKVGVLATARTLSGAKFLQLRDQITEATGAQFLLQPCRGLVDRSHEVGRIRLLDHMARIRHAAHLAVLDFVMQPARLLVDVDEAIVLAGEDGDRHGQFAVGFRRQHCGRDHQRGLGGAGPKLRWTHGQGFGETIEFSRDGFRSEQLPQRRRPHQAAEDR